MCKKADTNAKKGETVSTLKNMKNDTDIAI
jgi:hypothetical protein